MTERHSDPTTGFEHLRVIDLRLVQDRNDEWRLYVEGVETDLLGPLDSPLGALMRNSLAAYLAHRIRRRSTPFPMRLWSRFWRAKPWGAP